MTGYLARLRNGGDFILCVTLPLRTNSVLVRVGKERATGTRIEATRSIRLCSVAAARLFGEDILDMRPKDPPKWVSFEGEITEGK